MTSTYQLECVVWTYCDGKFDAHSPGWERAESFSSWSEAKRRAAHYQSQGQKAFAEWELA